MLLIVWLAYDFGAELRDKRLGRAMAAAALLCFGSYRSYLGGYFAELLALLFTFAFLLYALRLLRQFNLADLVAAGLMLGAVAYTSLSLSLVALLGWTALLALSWARPRQDIAASARLGLAIGLPAIALLGSAPWLVNNLAQIWPISPSPFPAEPGSLALIIREHGIVIVLLSLWGIWSGLRAAGIVRFVSLMMLLWLLLVIEVASIGFIGRLLPPLAELTNAPNLARHGVTLPFTWFGGIALLQLWDSKAFAGLRRRLAKAPYLIAAGAAALLIGLTAAFHPLLDFFGFPPAALTHDDVAAMTWLRENAPADALVLAADGNAWLPIFAERRAVDFRAYRYFEWHAPTRPIEAAASANYVYSPADLTPPADASLALVFERGGVRVLQRIEA